MADATTLEYFSDGDIPPEWEKYISSKNIYDLEGTWELLLPRSDPCDEIMSLLKISSFKRKLLRTHKTVTQVEINKDDDTENPQVKIISYLPMGTIKSGVVPTDGSPFEQYDTDTQVVWTNQAAFLGNRLLQKRQSNKGIMYDVRAVFSEDPEHILSESPLYLFRWTHIAPDGQKVIVNRWHIKNNNAIKRKSR